MGGAIEYKVVELSTVTDEELTKVINEWVGRGWSLDGINFAMSQASKRPAMAFVLFTKGEGAPGKGEGASEEE